MSGSNDDDVAMGDGQGNLSDKESYGNSSDAKSSGDEHDDVERSNMPEEIQINSQDPASPASNINREEISTAQEREGEDEPTEDTDFLDNVNCMVCDQAKDSALTLLCDSTTNDPWFDADSASVLPDGTCGHACHTYCCDPPLARMPRANVKWYCVVCKPKRLAWQKARWNENWRANKARSSEKEDEEETEACDICNTSKDEFNLLLCDGGVDGQPCSNARHTYCCVPPLKEVPPGHWYCGHCGK